MSAITSTRPKLSDWPADYIDDLRERDEEFADLSDDQMLRLLVSKHKHMRFGRCIDLNRQHGFYLHRGDGLVTLPDGTDCGYVIGALSSLSIDITNTNDPEWWTDEAEAAYGIVDGPVKLKWALTVATGPWFLTTEHEEARYESWHWLTIRFLNVDDDAAFRKVFP